MRIGFQPLDFLANFLPQFYASSMFFDLLFHGRTGDYFIVCHFVPGFSRWFQTERYRSGRALRNRCNIFDVFLHLDYCIHQFAVIFCAD